MTKFLEDVFVTEGVPQYTFVKPPNYNEILLDIRKVGKPVIIEGQSGTGKTTTVKKILEQIGGELSIEYLSARKAINVEQIFKLVNEQLSGFYVIDDFHRLSTIVQGLVASLAKLAAEEGEGTRLPKLIIIGINEIGSELISLVPDIAKRCGIHKISSGDMESIARLIQRGSSELNIRFLDYEAIFNETKGDYWLTQILCQSICSLNDRELKFNLLQVREKVIKKLHAAYNTPVKEFCRGKRFRKSNDPYFKLLRLIGRQESSIADLNKLANQYEDFKGSINNIKERRLDILLQTKESLNRFFYYNTDSKNFAIEDPALFYYIKHLDWNKLRDDCGFNEAEKNLEYDLAISFAGENRELARRFANKFEIFDVNVFFDELYESNLLGKALSKQFTRIFNDDSAFVLCLLDKYHKEKVWTTFERETFKKRVAEEAIIPVYLDETIFPGIPEDIYGIDFRNPVTEELMDDAIIKIVDRISQ